MTSTRLIAVALLAGVVAFAGFVGAGGTTKTRRCNPAHPCTTSTTTTQPTTTTPSTYLFDDEFDGTGAPDSAKWWATPWCSTSANDQEGCFNAANAYRDGSGHLVLAITAGTMGRPYDHARVQTFREGSWPPPQVLVQLSPPVHVEARIQFSEGLGVWGQFWFNANGSGPGGGLELDVQEFRGKYPTQDTCHVHVLKEWGTVVTTPFDGSADYHIYWTDYYPDHVVFGVDGQTCGQTTFATSLPVMVRLTNMVGVPGTWGGDGGPAPVLPGLMLVDYVRAWSL